MSMKIFKKMLLGLVIVAGLMLLILPSKAQAATFTGRLDDQAGLFENRAAIDQEAQNLAENIKASVFVVTTQTNQESSQTFSRNYLAQQIGAGNNGVVLLIDMGNRKVYIWGTGNMRYYLTRSRVDHALDLIQPQLSDNDYEAAVDAYFSQLRDFVENGVPGRKISVNPETGAITFHHFFKPQNVLIALVIALFLPGIFAWSVIMRYQMKDASAVPRYNLHENGQLDLTDQKDLLVNQFVTTRRIPRSDNSGGDGFSSGSGGSGGGRSF